ncbi:MAG TPA: hypothetical protein VK586_02545 [Streptosporangiaceae bacterium]|nr:hypothetical protein [Streptosporangiaceae bacterium]
MTGVMRQEAPYPQILADLLAGLDYNPPGRAWAFRLDDTDRGQGSAGLTLIINITGPNSYPPHRTISVNHYMLVPPAAYNRQSWTDWLFEQITQVELHERMEYFRIGGQVTYAPNHGPGWSPYLRTVLTTGTDRRTSFRGELNPA